MRTVLALDLGTQTGWAIGCAIGGGVAGLSSGSQSFKTSRIDGAGMRYLRFRRWLESLNKEHRLTEVYFEEVRRHIGTDASHVYGGFMAHLMAWCEEMAIPYESVPVGTIKLFATGKGNASKEQMIASAGKLGIKVIDDNQADAVHLLRYVMSEKAA